MDTSKVIQSYTTMRILQQMKCQVGLEGMLEYMNKFIKAVDTATPKVTQAVDKSLRNVDLVKFYEQANKL